MSVYHKEDKCVVLENMFGEKLSFYIVKGNLGLHVISGGLSILVDSLRFQQPSECHYTILMIVGDSYVGTLDFNNRDSVLSLDNFFRIEGF